MELYAGKSLEPIELSRQQTVGLDDQQVRLVWLAGFFDGEGTMGIYKMRNRKTQPDGWQVRVSLCNTHYPTKELVKAILEQIGVSAYWQDSESHNDKWQARWGVSIGGQRRSLKFLEAIYPYLVTKKLQASVLVAYIKSRQNQPGGGRMRGGVPLNGFEESCIEVIKTLKHTNNLNEQTLHTANLAVKMCSELHRDMQN